MLVLIRIFLDGPVMLLSGIVLMMFGGAGLLGTGGATHSRLRTTKPAVYVGEIVLGVVLLAIGAALIVNG